MEIESERMNRPDTAPYCANDCPKYSFNYTYSLFVFFFFSKFDKTSDNAISVRTNYRESQQKPEPRSVCRSVWLELCDCDFRTNTLGKVQTSNTIYEEKKLFIFNARCQCLREMISGSAHLTTTNDAHLSTGRLNVSY